MGGASLFMVALAIGGCQGLLLATRHAAAPSLVGPRMLARGRAVFMQTEPAKEMTWNTALDADGETYYWNSAGESTYEKPATFDPSTAKAAGQFKAVAADGALYDDEIEDTPIVYKDGQQKPGISTSMRDRLINESRGLGADPNAKNPFLYAFGAVGVFVVLGALAINM